MILKHLPRIASRTFAKNINFNKGEFNHNLNKVKLNLKNPHFQLFKKNFLHKRIRNQKEKLNHNPFLHILSFIRFGQPMKN